MSSYTEPRALDGSGSGSEVPEKDLTTSGDTVSALPAKLQEEQQRKQYQHQRDRIRVSYEELYHESGGQGIPEEEAVVWKDERVRRLLGSTFAPSPSDVRAAEAQAEREFRRKEEGQKKAADVVATLGAIRGVPASDPDGPELRRLLEHVAEYREFTREDEKAWRKLSRAVRSRWGIVPPTFQDILWYEEYSDDTNAYPYK